MMKNENPDWSLIARRLEQTTQYTPWSSNPFLILGNAYVKIGERDKAIRAYQNSFDNLHGEDPNKLAITDQIQKLKQAEDISEVGTLRPYFLE